MSPHTHASGIADTGYHFACWYERDIDIVPSEKKVLRHFGAVDYVAWVWVNGKLVVTHEGGHTPLFFPDITFALSEGAQQTVTVLAKDDPLNLTKPRGKQDWPREPHSIWHPRITGIWQPVWLEVVASTFVSKIRWTPCVYVPRMPHIDTKVRHTALGFRHGQSADNAFVLQVYLSRAAPNLKKR